MELLFFSPSVPSRDFSFSKGVHFAWDLEGSDSTLLKEDHLLPTIWSTSLSGYNGG